MITDAPGKTVFIIHLQKTPVQLDTLNMLGCLVFYQLTLTPLSLKSQMAASHLSVVQLQCCPCGKGLTQECVRVCNSSEQWLDDGR